MSRRRISAIHDKRNLPFLLSTKSFFVKYLITPNNIRQISGLRRSTRKCRQPLLLKQRKHTNGLPVEKENGFIFQESQMTNLNRMVSPINGKPTSNYFVVYPHRHGVPMIGMLRIAWRHTTTISSWLTERL